ncbi:hypothetical protein [Mangrovibacterium lignilyticum]|uniref:hypothetical protein n=1 Tax=Mangrovibacterium lignilyticum TaxID=2668052 RepID=UPI0013D83005|nr:hypothetical protein [Mangrovibacterium lignilyticum]
MKICMPIIGKNAALVNILADDFYKANFYCVHDVVKGDSEIFSKPELMMRFGLDLRKGGEDDIVRAIISPNVRPMAFKILKDNDIKVFRPTSKLVDENIKLYKEEQLKEHDIYSVEDPSACGLSCGSCSSKTCK